MLPVPLALVSHVTLDPRGGKRRYVCAPYGFKAIGAVAIFGDNDMMGSGMELKQPIDNPRAPKEEVTEAHISTMPSEFTTVHLSEV
jgi:hypothetical protein